MILRERVSSRVPLGAALLILTIGLLILPGWTLAVPSGESGESTKSAAAVGQTPAEESAAEDEPTKANKSEQPAGADTAKTRQRAPAGGGGGAAATGEGNQNQPRRASGRSSRAAGAGGLGRNLSGGGGLGANLQGGGGQATRRGAGMGRNVARGGGMGGNAGGGGGMGRNVARGGGIGQRFLTGEIHLPADARVESFKLRHVGVAELLPFINQRVASVRYAEKVSTYARRDYTYPAGAVALSFDDRTRTLFARGGPEAIEQVREVHRILDVPVDELPAEFGNLKIYRIENTSVETVGRVLGDLRVSGATFLALVSANAIAIGADEQTHDEILKIIQALDVAGPNDQAPAPEEGSSIEGTWEIVRAEDNGRTSRLNIGAKLIIGAGTLTMVAADESHEEALRYQLDTGGPSNHIMLMNGNRAMLGIYEVDGEMLKLCFNEKSDGQRPTEFASLRDSPNDVLLLARRAE